MAQTTLLQALNQADFTSANDYEVEHFTLPNAKTGQHGTLYCCDEEITHFHDQPINVDADGCAWMVSVEGDRIRLAFLAHVPWQPTLLMAAAATAHAALGEDLPTWQVWLPGFKTLTDTPDKLIIIRAHEGRDVVEAVNGRADCSGRWFPTVSPVSPGHYFELPRDQADLDRLLDAEGYKFDANGCLVRDKI